MKVSVDQLISFAVMRNYRTGTGKFQKFINNCLVNQ
jgi:hypothetical protein